MDEKLKKDYISTIGVDVTTIKIEILNNKKKKELITLSVWDLAGQNRFQNIRSQFYLGSVLGLLIFDVTNKDSFTNLKNWIEEVENVLLKSIPFFLIGNKIDLPNRVIGQSEMEAIQKKHKQIVSFFETSALTGKGIKDLFRFSAEYVNNGKVSLSEEKSQAKTTDKKTTKKSSKKIGKKTTKKEPKKPSSKPAEKTVNKTTKKSSSSKKSTKKKKSA